MNRNEEYNQAKRQIAMETDAEIALGQMLAKSGVDFETFMEQWDITHAQFNTISHYMYGLTQDVSSLPPALAVLLTARRQPLPAAA